MRTASRYTVLASISTASTASAQQSVQYHSPGCRSRNCIATAASRPRASSLLTGLPSAETESLQVWSGGERKVGRDDRRSGRATLARRETASMRPAPPDKTRGPDRPQDDAPSAQAGQSANQ